MKKYILASLFAGVAFFGLTSCEDDRDSNPTLNTPESFVLNEPALAGNTYDLENSDSLVFTCKQPDYGYTAAVTYYVQLSLTDVWENELDADGKVVGNPKMIELENYSTTAKVKANSKDMNKAIMQMGGYAAEEEMPETTPLYIRLRAKLASGLTCYSNTIQTTVKPFFAVLVAADPELWYLIGACVGDGSWGSAIGTAVYPMSPVEGGDFNDETGRGPLTFTGYFTPDLGFKIVRVPGEWADQWGGVDGSIDNPKRKDDSGEGGDFKVPVAGYYRIDLNTNTNELKFTALEEDPKEYSQMLVSGGFNGWATDVQMTPCDTYAGARPHVWMYDISTTDGTELKFLVDSSWNPNWGNSTFPYGWGVGNGPNIPVGAGDYRVIFNDITGYYHFFNK